MNKAIVLLSGGLDSATCLYWAQQRWEPHALLFDYGQRHKKELQSAAKIARAAKVRCETVKFQLPWGGSSLVGKGARLPQNRSAAEMAGNEIPSTYVPARNTIFLSFALSFADASGAEAILIGANAVDFSGYPDCRPDYIMAMGQVAELGTKAGASGRKIEILAPLVQMSKARIIRLGFELGVPYRWTWSCYQGGKRPCGKCDSCLLRAKGFEEAGRQDPLLAKG